MVTATPDTFLAVLQQLMNDAASLPEDKADELGQMLDEVANDAQEAIDEIKRLPEDVLQRICELMDPPDWWSLLLLLLTKIRDLDPTKMSLGTTQPTGWVRMLTLTYTPGVEGVGVTLGLGLVKDGDLLRGLWLRATQGETHVLDKNPLSFAITSTGGGDWAIPFQGGVRPPELPGATVDIEVALWGAHPPLETQGNPTVKAGSLSLQAKLSTTAPLYDLTLRVGTEDTAGLYVGLDKPDALAGWPISIELPEIDFTPTARFVAGEPAPTFSLGQREH